MLALLVYNRPTPLNLKFLSSDDGDDDDDIGDDADIDEDESDSTFSTVARSLLVGIDEE